MNTLNGTDDTERDIAEATQALEELGLIERCVIDGQLGWRLSALGQRLTPDQANRLINDAERLKTRAGRD